MWESKLQGGACGSRQAGQGGAPRVDEQQALVAQDASVVHDEGAGLLWEVAEADCVCGLPPRLQLCFPLLSELVESPSDSGYKVYCHAMKAKSLLDTLHCCTMIRW